VEEGNNKAINYCSRHLPQNFDERTSPDKIINLLRKHQNSCSQCRENLRKIYLVGLKEEIRAGKEEKMWRYIYLLREEVGCQIEEDEEFKEAIIFILRKLLTQK
jgi:hypothetical protein